MFKEFQSKKGRKVSEIFLALCSDPPDVAALRRMAISEGGLLTNEIRCKVWPKLLNVSTDELPPAPGMPDEQREELQEQLINIILQVLQRNPQLHYYQGYHDIVVTFLLVIEHRLATALVEKLSTHHLRDFMDPTMDSTKHILNYLMPIIDQVNPELHDFLQRAEVGTIFALSWLITWFGHVLSDFRHVVRLYDFFLACHPLMPIYFAAVIVLYREQEVLDCECDMASVHHLLSQIPQDLPYESLISQAGDLFVQFPPSELAREAAEQQMERIAASTFKDFELASCQEQPDTILRQRFRNDVRHDEHSRSILSRPRSSRFMKLAVMGLTVALGAAALAVVKSALDWAPKFELQIFP
ncbi:TBC1 domain family member 20 isoform X2 [Microcaecilia unicolor]|uniref:TBC1 domain family member 20 isoform X2 n=1 Tax=Microcaecilia unicolor TaxID=1415580 RepID=A0A6P7YZP5_9AMPH|nr:TBC1 domain family member 20 isoform X2 [Microcaecilia unicolor]